MNNLMFKLISETLRGKREALRQKARSERRTALEPLPFAIPALLIISGNEMEVGGYRRISDYESDLSMKLFRTVSTSVARRLIEAVPGLAKEVLNHKLIKDYLTVGPFKRLSRRDQAIKALRALLNDSNFFIEYQKRGFLDWDNGDVQAAMAIVYGWRKTVTKDRGIFQRVERIHQDGRKILAKAVSTKPDNLLLQYIDHRAKLAWNYQTSQKRAESIAVMEGLSKRRGSSTFERSVKLLGLSSLVDVGLRFREKKRAVKAINNLQRILAPRRQLYPGIVILRAWTEALSGRKTVASRLASTVARSREVSLRVSASQVLETVGNIKAAKSIRAKVSKEFLPRPNPLASPTLRLP